ncbi:tafazzin [Xylariomycetidae sp. FL2044]|nr:tafazzin [Xylariomycetidae sp. FL2044]KAH9897205.1 tafazzin [Xylariomycetidae sp. FL2044]
MPKKRHQNKYSKPPSVASPSLSISNPSRSNPEHHDRSVNAILADLRRSSLNSPHNVNSSFSPATPSVPPSIRQILQLPETPAPRPRRPQRRVLDQNGRRVPPGPPPPRSWISLSASPHDRSQEKRSTPGNDTAGRLQHVPLPGAYAPGDGSLMDMVLRRIAVDWEHQSEWNRFYLYTLPSRIRTALLAYVSEFHEPGVSANDLKLVLLGPPEEELADYGLEPVNTGSLNADVFHLDLSGSVGKSLTVKELGELLHPPKAAVSEPDLKESWDAPEPSFGPAKLLPNLTHLSLAVNPGSDRPPVSWKHLLWLSSKLSSLTHLSLSGWPEPSLTPNAKYAKMTSAATGRTVQFGATGPYSHALDGDWAEAILILKRLSKSLYGLEYLDLTGCADWFPALMEQADAYSTVDLVDWVGDWGKITTLRLCSGYAVDENSSPDQVDRFTGWIGVAARIERYIRAQRRDAGIGSRRWIDVVRDEMPEKVGGGSVGG